MFSFTESDLKVFFGNVVQIVAKELQIKDWEWQYQSELLKNIKTQNQAVFSKLEDFFKAYKEWHSFHVEVDKEGKVGCLNDSEHKRLLDLIQNRDCKRNTLISAIRPKI